MSVLTSTSTAIRPRRRARSLAQEVVDSLLGQIQSGELGKGDRLPTESELMRMLGVSRTVVREAISRLQAAGVVETRHGIGSFVLEVQAPHNFHIDPKELVTIHDILDVLQLRQSLESAAAGIAAIKRSPQDLDHMQAILREFRALLEAGKETVDADFRFHLAIAQATGNRYFVEFMSYLGQTVIPRTRINTASLGKETQARYLERVHYEHEEIARAIAMQNAVVASSAMQLHLNNSAERLRSTLEG
ncbi:FadR family transcriptional regulator [Allopusillimonas soli]|uniref:FadR family transcriptional regulator n=1 Tax=Allopusillimonas soli TaxID=659016 RepID=A0A853FJY3_9BURK|nr:FadR/GntR family transcriptional regulator [Allopusillimonas soli]NYT38246.1 FadR family transcriptional regulator [Allopusillimonas soli]TEA72176.1 FadR family transcriptional regulator [Allopusillimonas soli]